MKFVLIAFACLVLAGCFPNIAGDTHCEVLKRTVAPNGKAEAVLELVSGGATVSSGYVVHVGPPGFDTEKESNRRAYIVGSFDKIASVDVHSVVLIWVSTDRVVVSCPVFPDFYQNRATVIINGATINIEWKTENKPNQALQHNDPSCHESCLRTPRASRGRG